MEVDEHCVVYDPGVDEARHGLGGFGRRFDGGWLCLCSEVFGHDVLDCYLTKSKYFRFIILILLMVSMIYFIFQRYI